MQKQLPLETFLARTIEVNKNHESETSIMGL